MTDDRERLLELFRSMQSDAVPSLIAAHDEDDLKLLHGAMLRVLDRGEDPTVKELSTRIRRSVSRTSRLVDQLVRRGLAVRLEDPADRRIRRVRLSDKGRALLERIDVIRVEAQMEFWAHLTEDERRNVLHAMELFAKAARRIRDERD